MRGPSVEPDGTSARNPGAAHLLISEGGDGQRQYRPRISLAVQHACASWTEQPFMASGGEEVAAEIRHLDVLDREAVYAVHAQIHAVLR